MSDPLACAVLDGLGVSPAEIRNASLAARRNGTDVARELICEGIVREDAYAECVAAVLGLSFELPSANDEILRLGTAIRLPSVSMLRTCNGASETKIFLSPAIEQLPALARELTLQTGLAKSCRIATQSAIRERQLARSQNERFEKATMSLSANSPARSARIVLTGWQSAAIGAGAILFIWWLTVSLRYPVLLFHMLAAVCFTAWIVMRFCAALKRTEPPPADFSQTPQKPPTYSVVVALHREREVVARLIAGLEALNWPKSRLEIFLICEADDQPTVSLCRRHTEGKPQFHVVLVPPGEPRTKPKALNFVLPVVKGDYLVLYDAEDVPHPDQLNEAMARYREAPADVACLQAPLIIRNAGHNWLTSIFAMEYAGLFRAFLPWLARHRLPIPLGGTSNHFKVSSLKAVEGWDSHNVTEDADLGMRLKRAGFGIETITLPTYEDAPEVLAVWVKQRTRWLKGWVQTYAVHMRNPTGTLRDLGVRRFIVFQLLFHGMVTSALLLPFAAVLIALAMTAQWSAGLNRIVGWPIVVLDLSILGGGFLSFIALALRGASRSEWFACFRWLPTVPLYWLCVSYAAYRGLLQLFHTPHAWEKTDHGLASRADKRDPRHRIEPVFDIVTRGGRVSP
ncbi:glycosyltransferase [Fulvimarina sp. MAC3]|uniref:glycosyltransferase n=1 Tax=Fulvimarina sp. MAC3 TaxID=3148887 RepID=UPI0031FDCDB6